MHALSISQLTVAYHQQPVLHDLSLTIDQGDIVCLLGPSGCGKTTALKTIAGLQTSQTGRIELFGHTVADGSFNLPTQQRQVGFIFQDYALFPHMTVAANIAYGLNGLNRGEKQQRIRTMLELVELQPYADRYPHELSGGQQQRIALARALAPGPQLLLMDEPFSNIDSQVKHRMMSELRQLIKRSGVTAIFVTHAKDEAFAFADQTAVMMNGQIQQYDTPARVFNQPANLAVAQFMEAGNLCETRQLQEILTSKTSRVTAGEGTALLKRHLLTIQASNTGVAEVQDIQFTGRGYLLSVAFLQQSLADWQVECDDIGDLAVGSRVALSYSASPVLL